MTQANGKREALISIMNKWYGEIREIEEHFHIFVDGNDLRARIEYFHDAVRVLTSNPQSMYDKQGRLSVEHLAYDLSCLRYIQDKPLAKLNHANPAPQTMPQGAHSKSREVQPVGGSVGAQTPPPKPSPTVRAELGMHYKNYTVLFAALFAETVDINYHSRVEENDTQVEDLAQIEQMIRMIEMGQMQEEQVEEAILHLDSEELQQQLMVMLHKKSMRKRKKFEEMMNWMKQQMQVADKDIAVMDQAHTTYLSGQMMLYQDSKDMVKKLAAQGMNLAGQFLENAMAQAQGRGQGRGY